jgi:hypothetical protein
MSYTVFFCCLKLISLCSFLIFIYLIIWVFDSLFSFKKQLYYYLLLNMISIYFLEWMRQIRKIMNRKIPIITDITFWEPYKLWLNTEECLVNLYKIEISRYAIIYSWTPSTQSSLFKRYSLTRGLKALMSYSIYTISG